MRNLLIRAIINAIAVAITAYVIPGITVTQDIVPLLIVGLIVAVVNSLNHDNVLLMLGGLYLCYEGSEKVYEAVFPHEAHTHESKLGLSAEDPKALEDQKVAGAIRTDFILSAEIMAIALASIPNSNLPTQTVVLALVGIVITIGVYGVVALIVKADDFGLVLASNGLGSPVGGLVRGFGRGLVKFMPMFLKILAIVGTAAMIWVGGGILVHGLESYGFGAVGHLIHDLALAASAPLSSNQGFLAWVVTATGYGIFGLIVGLLMIPLVSRLLVPSWKALASLGR